MNKADLLENLKSAFESRFQNSKDKKVLMEREITGYSLIFDENKLPLLKLSYEDEPLADFFIPYCSMNLFLIRQFYHHFIVEGADKNELKKVNEWGNWLNELKEAFLEDFSEPFSPEYYFDLMECLLEYIEWLKDKVSSAGRNIPDYGLSTEKEYKSLNRAYAFCILKMHQEGKISPYIIGSKKSIVKLFNDFFPGHNRSTGRQVYEILICKGLYSKFDSYKILHKPDYEYGIKLYKEIFQD